MANPQKENGYTPIANEIMEALARTQLNGYECRYLWVLLRKTYGWNKKEDRIANSQFSEESGIKRPHICRTEKSLLQRNIVTKLGNKLSFNKDYTGWRELPKKVTVTKSGNGVTNSGSKKLPKLVHTKDKSIITKETSKKEFLQGKQWNELIDAFETLNPMYIDFYKNKTERNALEVMAQKIGYDKLLSTIRALPEVTSRPYAPRITKPTELRRDFGKLLTFYNQELGKEKAKKPLVI